MADVQLMSVLTCPRCGHAEQEVMPVDACCFFHSCDKCGELISPKPGDCCVFCSYGSVPCPPMQEGSGNTSCCSS